jgi:hypothetical protein
MKAEDGTITINGHEVGAVELGPPMFYPVDESSDGLSFGPVNVTVKIKLTRRTKWLFRWWKIQAIVLSWFRR